MAMVRVMRKADEVMSHVMHVSIERSVGADHGGLHHVSQGVDAGDLVEYLLTVAGL